MKGFFGGLISGLVCMAAPSVFSALGERAPGAPLFYTAAPRYELSAWVQGGERFPNGASLTSLTGTISKPLAPGFFASADPEISFDGRRLLFSGKQRAQDRWQIWEMTLPAAPPRRITAFGEDCIRPLYLPGDRLVYARRVAGNFRLEAMPLAGGEPLPLTYAPGNFLPSQVLRDGRILFETPWPIGASSTTDLFTVYSDGSGMEAVRCDHGPSRSGSRQLGSGDIVFSTGSGLAGFRSAHTKQIPLAAPGGDVAGPVAEIPGGRWLLSFRPKGAAMFGLYEWAPDGRTPPVRRHAPRGHAVQPVVAAPRELPKRHPSGLHDRDGATLLCLNSYESPLSIAGGSVTAVKLYSKDAAGRELPLGQAAVESDGSFYLRVPTEMPLRIELAGKSGTVVAAEKGWFWMRRGEQRICVGCHAGPERSPENAVPKVLLRSTQPALMMGSGGKK